MLKKVPFYTSRVYNRNAECQTWNEAKAYFKSVFEIFGRMANSRISSYLALESQLHKDYWRATQIEALVFNKRELVYAKSIGDFMSDRMKRANSKWSVKSGVDVKYLYNALGTLNLSARVL